MLLEVSGLQKSYSGVPALKNGQFVLEAGSVHALCGGNGAGKSTFLSIVMGIQSRDAGTIKLGGRAVNFTSPKHALAAGISIIEQELSPVPAMSVAENIFLGREPVGSFGRIDFKAMNAQAQALLDSLDFDISAKDLMMDLSVARVQLVEIAKALSYDAEIIIMDEPTSALGESEAEHLFEAIATLKARGKGVIYVSHRLSEIFQIADRYTVFRDGQFVGSGAISEARRDDLIQMIVGRPLTQEFDKQNTPTSDVMLSVRGLKASNGVRDISFDVCRGEILALYGLMGSGRTEIFERLFGLSDHTEGVIELDGTRLDIRSPAQAIAHGLAFVTEDRKESGLVLSADVRANICLAQLYALGVGSGIGSGMGSLMSPVMSTRREAGASKGMIEKFNIKAASDRLGVNHLSGGNQQKVVLSKWFLTKPKILFLDEPTRGVDVGAKREIYRIMSDFAAAGGAIVLVSSETDEVAGMADRVLVMRDGRIAGEVARQHITAEKLVHMAA